MIQALSLVYYLAPALPKRRAVIAHSNCIINIAKFHGMNRRLDPGCTDRYMTVQCARVMRVIENAFASFRSVLFVSGNSTSA